jgi:hypothetical protein
MSNMAKAPLTLNLLKHRLNQLRKALTSFTPLLLMAKAVTRKEQKLSSQNPLRSKIQLSYTNHDFLMASIEDQSSRSCRGDNKEQLSKSTGCGDIARHAFQHVSHPGSGMCHVYDSRTEATLSGCSISNRIFLSQVTYQSYQQREISQLSISNHADEATPLSTSSRAY